MPSLKAKPSRAARVSQLVENADLSGGLDLRRSPTLMASNRARVLRNYALSEPGALVVRPGYHAFSSNTLGSGRVQGGQRVYLGSTLITVIAYEGAVYEVRSSGVINSTAVYSTISTGARVFFPYDRSLVAVMDSNNRPRKSTDGLTWTLMGIDAGSSAAVVSSLSSGSLSASEFEIGYTYKDRGLGHEGNVSSAISTITMGATGAIHVTVSNSTDPQVDAIVLYARNKTAGEVVLRKVSSEAMQGGAGSNSTYRILSSGWSANDEAPTNHTAPTNYQFATIWKNRWWARDGSVGNRLHFTELFQPQSWPALFYIDIPFERGDEITALIAQGDTLLVFGQSKVYLVIGQTSLDFEVRPSAGAQAGSLGPRCVEAIEQGVLHASAEGLFLFDGATDKLLTFDIEPGWKDLIQNTASTTLGRMDVVYEFKNKEVRMSVPRLYPRAARGEWVLDLNRTRELGLPAWTDTDREIVGYIHFDGDEPTAGDRGRLLSWPSTGGKIFEESTGTSANSSNMTAEYEGPHTALGLHRARVIRSFVEFEPNDGAWSVDVYTDGVSDGAQSVNIAAAGSEYDAATYDTGSYDGSGRKAAVLMHRLSREGRTVWMTTSYTGQAAFRHFTYAHDIVPETAPRGFSE